MLRIADSNQKLELRKAGYQAEGSTNLILLKIIFFEDTDNFL